MLDEGGSARVHGLSRTARATAGPIAIFLPSFAGGGAERVMLNLADGFEARGHEVDLLVGSPSGSYGDSLPVVRRVVDLRARRTLQALPGLVNYFRREKPRVLISAMDHANVAALMARGLARSRVPIVVTVHIDPLAMRLHEPPRGIARLMPWAMRRCYPRAQAIVAVSRGTAAALSRLLGVPSDRVRVIYNPLVSPALLSRAEEPLAHPWFAPGAPPVFLGVGRLAPQKDFATLVRAFARCRRGTPAKLLILGEGPERSRLLALIAELGLTSDVELGGFAANPFAYMRRAAAVVLSSVFEGFGNVLVEGMACGTAVISTDCSSGPSEILDAGRFGPLVPPRDPARLAEAMLTVLRQPPDRAALKTRAQDFAVAAITTQYLTLLEELAGPSQIFNPRSD